MSALKRYDIVAESIRRLFITKNAQYGDSAFTHSDIPKFQYWMRLSDIRRKTTRLDSLTDLAANGDVLAKRKLINDYRDLANYAIIAVAVLEDME